MLTPLFGVGWTEVLVIAGVVFVLFGAQRIPAAFRALGEGINSFKEGLDGKGKSEAGAAQAGSDRAAQAEGEAEHKS